MAMKAVDMKLADTCQDPPWQMLETLKEHLFGM